MHLSKTPIQFRIAASIILTVFFAGCAGNKPQKPALVAQRGWIGGNYKPVHVPGFFVPREGIGAFPSSIKTQKAAVLIISLATNTPAWVSGLHEGDLPLELDHKPVASLQNFRHEIDRRPPGALLPVRYYREGQITNCNVFVGRELFRKQGTLAIVLPPVTDALKLWPDPGFSLIVLGYKPNPGCRKELASVQEQFAHSCDPKGYQSQDEDWRAWLAIFCLSKETCILSQEFAPPSGADAQLHKEQ